jgi:signal transduction histidine kinase/ActR/RegA family two-component response regulator
MSSYLALLAALTPVFLCPSREAPPGIKSIPKIQAVRELTPADPLRETGSRLRIAGVFSTAPLFGQTNSGFALLLRKADDIAVPEAPPQPEPSWWTPERTLAILALALALAALGFIWVATLRARVRRQTAEIREHFERAAHLEAQLRQAQKLEAVGRLAGGIAHDFNNLLTVINGCADLLKGTFPPESSEAALIGDIATAGERAATLTNQLLVFSRKRTIACTAVDLNHEVAEAEKLLRRVLGETITIETFFQEGENTSLIQADPGLIHQILFNLAFNARDAMPRGGTLVLATLRVLDPAGNPVVRLLVSDTGCGMDEETQARIFEPFFTTKEVGQGTGLGLATVYGIVQSLGGTIDFRSAVGKGTTFEIDFPVAVGPLVSTASTEMPPADATRPLTVLLVEDDAAVRSLAQRILESRGDTVLVCDSPQQALDTAVRYEGTIDLLVTDVVMPHMNGRELAEALQKDRPSLKVLFMSGYTSDEVLRRGVRFDEVAFLQKPFKAGFFLAKVRQVMHTPIPDDASFYEM